MRPSHICTSCRLHLRFRAQLLQLQQARRGFTAGPNLQQTEQWSSRAQYPRRSRPQDTASPYDTRDHPTKAASEVFNQRRRPDPDQPPNGSRGRYSGQTLRPESLLDHLGAEAGSSQGRGGVRDHKREEPWLPPALKKKVTAFILCGSAGEQDAKASRLARDIASGRESDPAVLQTLGTHYWFVKAYLGLVNRRCKALAIQKSQHNEHADLAMPSELMSHVQILGIDANNQWTRSIWEISCAVAEIDDAQAENVIRRNEMLDELVTVWNMAMSSHLQRQSLQTFDSARLDWSFLPAIPALKERLSQGTASGTRRLSFANALAMLMPGNSREGSRFDLPSAALVTIHLLKASITSGSIKEGHRPLGELLETVYKITPPNSVPTALRTKLDTVGGPYEPVAESFGLSHSSRSPGRSSEDELAPHNNHAPLHSPGAGPESNASVVREPEMVAGQMRLPPNEEGERPMSTTPVNEMDNSQRLAQARGLAPPTMGLDVEVNTRDVVTDRFVNLRINRLGQAMQKQNLRLAEQVKQEVLNFALDPTHPQLPNQLYEHLLLTLLSLRNPQAAIEVWNHFIQLGRQPTAKTYTVMMRGAQHVRDTNAMERFWLKMRSAGIQPDIHAWSTRVFGLIRAGKVDGGLKSLSELSQEWISAARAQEAGGTAAPNSRGKKQSTTSEMPLSELTKLFDGDVNGVPKPNLVVMNSAVSALANKNDKLIPNVLAWGRGFGLEPDLTTYNVLLNVTMRNGQADEAIGILNRMQERGIEADSTTWTVLLTALFEGRSLDDLAPEDQHGRIMTFVTSLESATNSTIDSKGYALIIDRLLKRYSNPAAANAVLVHMVSKGLQPTAHIYTILMGSYFQQQPPDFAAADALWNHIQASDAGRGAALDSVFYDRMVEGYALNHRLIGTQPMLNFLDRMSAEKRRPSWRALEYAARALAETQDWNRLLSLVDDARRFVKEGRAEMVVDERSFGQRDFWQFVVQTGLLREEGVVRPEQLMREQTGEGPIARRLNVQGGW